MAERAGIRELRQQLSRYVERVKDGATVDVTEHGRLVARLVPAVEAEDALADLAGRGLVVRRASLDLDTLAAPSELRPGERPASEALAEDRAGQRY